MEVETTSDLLALESGWDRQALLRCVSRLMLEPKWTGMGLDTGNVRRTNLSSVISRAIIQETLSSYQAGPGLTAALPDPIQVRDQTRK